MNKQKVLLLIFAVSTVVLAVLLIFAQKKINNQDDKLLSLENRLNSSEKNVKDLESEKEDLESKNLELIKEQDQNLRSQTRPQIREQAPQAGFYENNGQNLSNNNFATVVYKSSSCDYFILENASGYIIVEWMGGNDPDLGDKLIGSFNSFGTKEFYNQTSDTNSNLWVDDYMLSKETVTEKIQDECK